MPKPTDNNPNTLLLDLVQAAEQAVTFYGIEPVDQDGIIRSLNEAAVAAREWLNKPEELEEPPAPEPELTPEQIQEIALMEAALRQAFAHLSANDVDSKARKQMFALQKAIADGSLPKQARASRLKAILDSIKPKE